MQNEDIISILDESASLPNSTVAFCEESLTKIRERKVYNVNEVDYENPWLDGEGSCLTSNDIQDYVGFVYIIENNINGMYYVGKKLFYRSKKRMIKGRKRREITESDWKKYYGSCQPLSQDIEKFGKENFTRKVLFLCKYKRDLTFFETYVQMIMGVLEDPKSYNTNILGKFFLKDPSKSLPFVENLVQIYKNFVNYTNGEKPDIRGENNPAKRPEVRKKISEKISGKNHPQYGKKISDEHKSKLHTAAQQARTQTWLVTFPDSTQHS